MHDANTLGFPQNQSALKVLGCYNFFRVLFDPPFPFLTGVILQKNVWKENKKMSIFEKLKHPKNPI